MFRTFYAMHSILLEFSQGGPDHQDSIVEEFFYIHGIDRSDRVFLDHRASIGAEFKSLS